MKKFIKKLCDRYELVIQKEFIEGYNSEGVFKVIDKNNTPFVLKAAIGNKDLIEEELSNDIYKATQDQSLKEIFLILLKLSGMYIIGEGLDSGWKFFRICNNIT